MAVKHIEKVATAALISGGLAIVLAVGAYALTVGMAAGYDISNDGNDWAAFGDYVGGVLGTIFGALAFIVVLWTLLLQQHQIAQLKEQDKFRELQSSLATLANGLDQALGKDVAVVYGKVKTAENLLKLLIVLGAVAREAPHTKEQSELFEPVREALDAEFALLVRALDTYVALISFYQKRGGDADISKVYIARFDLVAKMVHAAHPYMELGLSNDAYKMFELPVYARG